MMFIEGGNGVIATLFLPAEPSATFLFSNSFKFLTNFRCILPTMMGDYTEKRSLLEA
jgi:hypothetical protein